VVAFLPWRVAAERRGRTFTIPFTRNTSLLNITAHMAAHHRLKGKLRDLCAKLEVHPHLFDRSLYLGQNVPIGGTAHQAGTMRFGADPSQSVLDLNCKAHGIDNLYVTDASFFPSIGAVNPTLTIIANALRIGDHVITRLK
jgi:choline dehydrogenase-like flavoprotein